MGTAHVLLLFGDDRIKMARKPGKKVDTGGKSGRVHRRRENMKMKYKRRVNRRLLTLQYKSGTDLELGLEVNL